MAFGDNPVDESLRAAWHDFCDEVKAAGDHVFKDISGSSDGERTNAFRYLTQNLSQAFDIWLENRDTRRPYLHAFCGPTRGLGADNADCIYLQSWINDHDTYKISGNKGTARMFNIAVQGPWRATLHEPFGDTPFANVFGEQLETDWDGNFVLWISPEPHPGNWMQSVPGVRKIFYRQYFDTWDEVPASYQIERVGDDAEDLPPAIEPAALIDSFERAGRFVRECTQDWPDTLWERFHLYDNPNVFSKHVEASPTSNNSDSVDTRRGRIIEELNWDLPMDSALIIEFECDSDAFWQLGACTVFGASLQYRYRQVNLTSGLSAVDPDGVTRIVFSHADPGFANWLDTQEHTHGWLLFRFMTGRTTPELRTRVVKFADLETELRDVATRITPEARRAELRRRRHANHRRFPIL